MKFGAKFLTRLFQGATAAAIVFLAMSSATSFAEKTTGGLYYKTFGDQKNPAVVYLHGGPGYNSFNFENSTAQLLADQGFYVVIFDQAGSGRSDAPPALTDYTFKNAAEDVTKVMDAANVEEAVLLGHSWGGALSLLTLKHAADRVHASIMVNSPVSFPQTLYSMLNNATVAFQQKGKSNEAMETLNLRKELFPNELNPPYNFTAPKISQVFYYGLMSGIFSPANPTPEAVAIQQGLNQLPDSQLLTDSKPGPVLGFFQNENLYEQNFFKNLMFNKQEVYTIYASEDRLFGRDQLNQIYQTLPYDHSIEIPAAAHNVFIDQRAEFVARTTLLVEAAYKKCDISQVERVALMALDYKNFDQNMNGGWRAWYNRGCARQAGLLIVEYLTQSPSKVDEYERRNLNFHAGQMFADKNLPRSALGRLRKALRVDEPPNDGFKWNAYVRGTIAFVEKNRTKLEASRADLANGGNTTNLATLDRLIKCFDEPYRYAYSCQQ